MTPMPESNDTDTLPVRRTIKPLKKKTVAKAKTVAAKPSTKRVLKAPAAPTEILFEQRPDPSQTPQPPYLWLDHPQDNEQLFAPTYSIRLGVGGAEHVELSIDRGAWQPCRLTSGYWWYDWSGIAEGKHTLVARMRTAGGLWYKTPPTTCRY